MEDIVAIIGFFGTIIIVTLGVPLVRAHVRKQDAQSKLNVPQIDERLSRIENAIEAMSIEVERISEGQRFVTHLLAERNDPKVALPRESTKQ
jgi:Co/Zn/Cd efflux system component